MKKYILALCLAGLLTVPLLGQAVSIDDLNLMVQQLSTQVSALSAYQVGAVTSSGTNITTTSPAPQSYSFPVLKQQTYSTLGRGLTSVMSVQNMSQLIAKTDSIISQLQVLRKQMSTSTLPIYTIKPTLISTDKRVESGDGPNDDTGIFTIKFKVLALGGPAYLSSVVAGNYIYVVDRSGVATSSNSIVATIQNNTDNNRTIVGNWKIESDKEETYTLTVRVPMGAGVGAGLYRTSLTGLKWGTSDSASLNKVYTGLNYRTDYLYLN